MKKIVPIGLLLCFVTACGVTNSKKFNPKHINGLWVYENTVSYQELGGYNLYHHFLYITYPHIQTCTRVQILRGHPANMSTKFNGLTKMDVTIAHLKKDRYKVKRINGPAVTENITYNISADSVLNGVRYLTIAKLKNGTKKRQNPTYFYLNNSTNVIFQKCLESAKDTTSIFFTPRHRFGS